MSDVAASSTADRSVVIERTFDAPARLVFQAHAHPEHLQRWFGPPDYPLTFCEMDFRTGGRFHFGLTGPDGVEGPRFGGQYLEIVPDKKIVYTNGFLVSGQDPAPARQMRVTLTFDDVSTAGRAKTRLVMTTVFGSVAMHDEHVGHGFKVGVNQGLDQLVAVVRDLVAAVGGQL